MKRKKIKKGIDTISLHTMVNYAVSKGCHFDKPCLEKFSIPEDLNDLQQATNQAIQALYQQKTFISLADSLPAAIASQYIHCSFFWSSLPNKRVKRIRNYLPNTAFFNLLLVNRPNEKLIRTEYDNSGNNLTQQAPSWQLLKNLINARRYNVTKKRK